MVEPQEITAQVLWKEWKGVADVETRPSVIVTPGRVEGVFVVSKSVDGHWPGR